MTEAESAPQALCGKCFKPLVFEKPGLTSRAAAVVNQTSIACGRCASAIPFAAKRYRCKTCSFNLCCDCGDGRRRSSEARGYDCSSKEVPVWSGHVSEASEEPSESAPALLELMIVGGDNLSNKEALMVEVTIEGAQFRTKPTKPTSDGSVWREVLSFKTAGPHQRTAPVGALIEVKAWVHFGPYPVIAQAECFIPLEDGKMQVYCPGFGVLQMRVAWKVVSSKPKDDAGSRADSVPGSRSSVTNVLQKLSLLKPANPNASVTHSLSVDLTLEVPKLLEFLLSVDMYPCLYLNVAVLERAMRRYAQIWLPMIYSDAAPETESRLVPPLDVEWVAHVHTLAPYYYQKDCASILGKLPPNPKKKLVPHRRLLAGREREEGLELAKALWRRRHPNEPFEATWLKDCPLEDIEASVPAARQWASSIGLSYDIILASERQMAFLSQCSLPHYRDKAFVKKATERYNLFLELKRRLPDDVFVPTYDVDACWRAHMVNTREYHDDTVRIVGKMLNHDDSMNDRGENSDLSAGWEHTREAWQAEFGRPAAVAGGMLRHIVTRDEVLVSSAQAEAIRSLDSFAAEALQNDFTITFGYVTQLYDDRLEFDEIKKRHPCTIHEGDLREPSDRPMQCVDSQGVCLFGGSSSSTKTVLFRTRSCHAVRDEIPLCNFCELLDCQDEFPLATAHLVGLAQLPRKEDLQDPARSAFLLPGSTPLLLRLGGKDLGILFGDWIGLKVGDKAACVRSVKSARGSKTGQPGWLSLSYFGLADHNAGHRKVWSKPPTSFSSPSSHEIELATKAAGSLVLKIEEMREIRVVGGCPRASEACIVAMAAAMLHAMLQPQPTALDDGAVTSPPAWNHRGSRVVARRPLLASDPTVRLRIPRGGSAMAGELEVRYPDCLEEGTCFLVEVTSGGACGRPLAEEALNDDRDGLMVDPSRYPLLRASGACAPEECVVKRIPRGGASAVVQTTSSNASECVAAGIAGCANDIG